MNQYTPKCPYCKSSNVKKISHFFRGATGLFNPKKLFSDIDKTWHCNHCKKDF